MKTVKIIILFFSILYYQTSFSQAKENFILKVINDQNIGIYDAVVLIDDAKPMLTDENGNAFLIVSTKVVAELSSNIYRILTLIR